MDNLEREVFFMNMKNKADILVAFSGIATILAAVVFIFKKDILTLAGTQWILIAIVLGIYAIYFKTKEA